jgi:flagellar motor switch protein FliM
MTAEQTRRLDQWFGTAAQRSVDSWGAVLSFPAQMKPKNHEWTTASDWLAALPPEAVGFRTTFGSADVHSLLILPRPLLLALLSGALGDQSGEPPSDRELTPIEKSLSAYLVRVLLVNLLASAWPGVGSLPIVVEGEEREVRWSRTMGVGEKVLLCTFMVVTPFGELDWCWLLPRTDWLKALTGTAPPPVRNGIDPGMEATLKQLPVEITVQLGSAEVSLNQVDHFQPGDVIVLDQLVNSTLLAHIAGEGKFRVAPGAIGGRQAVRIESILER